MGHEFWFLFFTAMIHVSAPPLRLVIPQFTYSILSLVCDVLACVCTFHLNAQISSVLCTVHAPNEIENSLRTHRSADAHLIIKSMKTSCENTGKFTNNETNAHILWVMRVWQACMVDRHACTSINMNHIWAVRRTKTFERKWNNRSECVHRQFWQKITHRLRKWWC